MALTAGCTKNKLLGMQNWRTPKLKKLAAALRSLSNEAELLNFLRDLCTLEELDELSTRWQVAKLLNQGESYRAIAQKTGVSTTTITRIAHWLEHGEGGYRAALKKSKN